MSIKRASLKVHVPELNSDFSNKYIEDEISFLQRENKIDDNEIVSIIEKERDGYYEVIVYYKR